VDSAALQLLNNRCLSIVFLSFFLSGSSLHLHTIIIGSFGYLSILVYCIKKRLIAPSNRSNLESEELIS